ncbi:DNA cytosine methyltransferase [Xanthobacter sp. 126]|uniref:DNA cytosine methyltransferase n=1 Tax=Xanthobacter sp. 126 TaxID=1131814 RepID=UPI0009DF5DF1
MALHPVEDPLAGRAIRGLALCAGVGGLELGLGIAEPGYRTVCYVERDSFAASVLVARMEDQVLCEAPIWDDLATFDGGAWRGSVDLLTAGYPCQPFSAAGRKLAEKDPRHLWPHVARIIGDCGPAVVFLENVAGHVDRGFHQVARELQGMGFVVEAGLFSALEVGAAHWRVRLFVLAYADRLLHGESRGAAPRRRRHSLGAGGRPGGQPGIDWRGGEELGGVPPGGRGAGMEAGSDASLPLFAPRPGDHQTWERVLAGRMDLEPCFHGLADGLAHRVDRYHAAGNGVCSLAAALAWRTLNARLQHRLNGG